MLTCSDKSLMKIFDFLDRDSLFACRRVCKRFHSVLHNLPKWRLFKIADVPANTQVNLCLNIKLFYNNDDSIIRLILRCTEF